MYLWNRGNDSWTWKNVQHMQKSDYLRQLSALFERQLSALSERQLSALFETALSSFWETTLSSIWGNSQVYLRDDNSGLFEITQQYLGQLSTMRQNFQLYLRHNSLLYFGRNSQLWDTTISSIWDNSQLYLRQLSDLFETTLSSNWENSQLYLRQTLWSCHNFKSTAAFKYKISEKRLYPFPKNYLPSWGWE